MSESPKIEDERASSRDGKALNESSDAARYESDNASSVEGLQDGVKNIEAISKAWDKKSLIIAYCSLMLMAIISSLEGQVTWPAQVFVTSDFASHSLVSTIGVVQSTINAVIKPPMAKIADVFGRLEAFCLCVGLYVLGYIQMAASQNVETFASAQIFYAAGNTGLLILQQIFIADTTDIPNRALFSTLPDIPYLVTTWIGSIITNSIIRSSGGWRWVYGMWTIIMPVAFLPLGLSLFFNARRAKKMGLAPEKRTTLSGGPVAILKNLWTDLDIGGILLLSAGFSLILVPCTLAATLGWDSPQIIAMITVGAIALIIFPFWEMATRFAKKRQMSGGFGKFLLGLSPYPLIPLHLLKNRTFAAGNVLAVFYFMVFYLSVQPYFYSYLLVVRRLDIQSASYITNTFNLASAVASFIISVLIKITNRYKWFVFAGAALYMLGVGLMMHYRTEEAPLSAIIGTQVLIGFGGGMLNVPAQLGVQASASHQEVGQATAMFLTLISVGGAIGSAISGAVWGRLIPSKLGQYLPDSAQDQVMAIYADINVAMTYEMGSPERIAINRSYQETMTTLLTIALCMCAPILICALLMSDYKLDKIDQGVKGTVIGGRVDENEKKVDADGSITGKLANLFRRRKA